MAIHSYPWYFADWRSSEAVLAMTAEQRDVYRELLDYCWEAGSLPTSERLLQRMSLATDREWKRCWPEVRKMFTERDGRLFNAKVDERRPDLEQWHDSRRVAGRKGADRRWHKQSDGDADGTANGSTSGEANGSAITQPIASPWPSSSSSLSLNPLTPFDEFRGLYESAGKPLNERDWEAAAHEAVVACITDWVPVVECLRAEMRSWGQRAPQMIPFPASWLKKRPWTRKAKPRESKAEYAGPELPPVIQLTPEEIAEEHDRLERMFNGAN